MLADCMIWFNQSYMIAHRSSELMRHEGLSVDVREDDVQINQLISNIYSYA